MDKSTNGMTIARVSKCLGVSIVIPVYNEAADLPACLDAVARQTVKPLEVIVVDNNSSDTTVATVQRYPYVTLLREPRQGVVHARNQGFQAAHGAIIGRIDADTVISDDWVETLQRIFADSEIDAVTGSARYKDMAWAPLLNQIDLTLRRYLAWVLGREVALQGANMAIRRSVWRAIQPNLCHAAGMHEDFDIGIHANNQGYNVVFDQSLVVSLSYRQAESCFVDFSAYLRLNPRTYAIHGLKSSRHMYPVIYLAMVFYIPIKILHHGYDTETQRFSWSRLMQTNNHVRVNPGTFVE
jgi:glycosyltransferase involved in cell wall biosynthesis